MHSSIYLVLVASLLLSSCKGVQQGRPIELAASATPKVADEPAPVVLPPALPPPASPPPQARQGFRVWIPRVVTPNGDVHAGHYIEVSDKAPQKELVKPDYEIPRAPKQIYRPETKPKPKTPAAGEGSPGAIARPPQALPPLPPYPQDGAYDPPQP